MGEFVGLFVGGASVGRTGISSVAFVAISGTTGAEVGLADGSEVTGAVLGLEVGLDDTGEPPGLSVESSGAMHRPPKPGRIRHMLSLEQQGTIAMPSSSNSHMSPLATHSVRESDCPVVGLGVGLAVVGETVGAEVGPNVGASEGAPVGAPVGELVGLEVGSGVALLARPVNKPATVAG